MDSLRKGLRRFAGMIGIYTDYEHPPFGLKWRSHSVFICVTVGVGVSVDVFLYSLIVPVLPFIVETRLGASKDQIQGLTSGLLAAYAGASVLFSPVAGYIADMTTTRQMPFLIGLIALLFATVMLYLGQNLATLVIARILQGISGAVVWTVGLALCIDTVGPKDLGKVTGTIFSFVSLASLLGPVAGGALYRAFGYFGVFAVGAIFIVIDFVMRLLVVEKAIAAKYMQHSKLSQQDHETGAESDRNDAQNTHDNDDNSDEQDADEDTPLLPKEKEDFIIHQSNSRILNKLPILHCFKSSSLVVAILIALVQATLIGTFDATITTEASDLFGFDSLQAGLLYIPLGVADLIMGPPSGWAVDKFGTKPVGSLGFLFLVPALISLRAVHAGGKNQIIVYCVILALNGLGLSTIAAPSVVESGAIVEKYHKANPGLFGERGPYAQLYGFSSMMYSGGLAIGPILAGGLRQSIGYGNMNLVAGIICLLSSMLCFFFLGGRPGLLQKKH